MAIFQCDLRRKNYGALWNNLFNFFHLRKKDKRTDEKRIITIFVKEPYIFNLFYSKVKKIPHKTSSYAVFFMPYSGKLFFLFFRFFRAWVGFYVFSDIVDAFSEPF